MSEPQPIPLRRKAGRPRVQTPRTAVSTWIAAPDHDRLIRIANARGVSVSALVRAVIIRVVTPKP